MFWNAARLLLFATLTLAIIPYTGRAQIDDLDALHEQVVHLHRQGKYSEATKIAKRSLALAEKKFAPDHPHVGTSLYLVAFLYQAQGRYDEAELLYKRELAISEKGLGISVGISLNSLAELYRVQGRYAKAEPLLRRALIISEEALGPDHPNISKLLNKLAQLYREQERYSEAEPLYNRSLATIEKALGKDHIDVATTLNNLATLYQTQGRFADAEPLYKRSLTIVEKALGKDHTNVATILNNLAELYNEQGRYSEAEPLYNRSLAIIEKALGKDHVNVSATLNNLATLYQTQGRFADAEPLYKRSLTIVEKALGKDHTNVATILNNLAALYEDQDRFADAELLFKRVLAIFKKTLGKDHTNVATTLNNLALLYNKQYRFTDAEPLSKRALTITEKAFGPNHPSVGISLNNLASTYNGRGRHSEAESLHKRALAITEKALGKDHPRVGRSLNNLAAMYFVQSDWVRATNHYRRSADVIARRSRRAQVIGQGLTGKKKSETEQSSLVFRHFVKSAHRLTQRNEMASAKIGPEMFQVAQWAIGSKAAASLTKMAARQATGDTQLTLLVRERQDLVVEWHKRDAARSTAVARPPSKRNTQAEEKNIVRMVAIDKRIADIDKRLVTDFPDYAALASPAPSTVADVQKQLKSNEALVLYLDTAEWKPARQETFIWVVTKTTSRWVRSGLGTEALKQRVSQLRRSLDPTAGGTRGALALGSSKAGLFDFALAHNLYKELLAPAQDVLKHKEHLFLVPSGPLTALPFHVLLTRPPSSSSQRTFRAAPWLIRRYALTTLPSVASLAALRRNKTRAKPKKDFVGFANPIFQATGKNKPVRIAATANAKKIAGGYARYFRGSVGNAQALSTLPPLPDTEDEVRAIAKVFGAQADIHSGQKATETAIKRLPLNNYRIVHFATHGLVAGEIKGLAEPALALSVPRTPTKLDDGLLTASEVITLKLNADWVILSACNTAAGDRPGAEALSGLARAFFYAGTQALLVSHWPVFSPAAVKLTTRTLTAMEKALGLGRSEALRRAMIDIIENGELRETHPSYWAPFVVVGEGG
jgi:CHAT domain-containing protein/tetratricopeptide (TPR) repeat protein